MINLINKVFEKKEKTRTGIVRLVAEGVDPTNKGKQYQMIWEIEEIASIDSSTKIKITHFSQTTETLSEWISTDMIEWIK